MLTKEQAAKGAKTAARRLGPAGCSARASLAARARWGKGKPVKPKPALVPPLDLLLAWLELAIDDYQDVAGWPLHRGKLADVIAFVKQSAKGE